MSTANKNKKIQTLDESLNKSVNNAVKWNNFRNELLLPLIRSDEIRPNKRAKFPSEFDESDIDPTVYTFDRIYVPSINIGRRAHLLYLATMFHNEMINNNDTNDQHDATVAKDFNKEYSDDTFFSMVRPLGKWNDSTTGPAKILASLWQNGIIFPFTHDITADKIETVDEHHLYNWKLTNISRSIDPTKNSSSTTIPGTGTTMTTTTTTTETTDRTKFDTIINSNVNKEQWQKIFSPLTYYKWLTPNSVLNNWTFSIDPNIAHTLNWYQFYLNRIAVFKETTIRYATELQRQHDLTKKKNALTNEFAKKNQEIKRSLQIKIPSNKINQDYRKFMIALNKLYEDFTKQI